MDSIVGHANETKCDDNYGDAQRSGSNTFGIRRRNVIHRAKDSDGQIIERDNNEITHNEHVLVADSISHHEQNTLTQIHDEIKSSSHKNPLIPTVSNSSSSSTQHQEPSSHPPHHDPIIHSSSDTSRTKLILYKYSADTTTGQVLTCITQKLKLSNTRSGSALPGFLSLLLLTMANYMLAPMRDAAALAVGVSHIPTLTLASTILAIGSSVPVGWLFEAPNPIRWGKSWRDRVGLTRGETQGTSLALFLRCFAICLLGYALTFKALEWLHWSQPDGDQDGDNDSVGLMEIFVYIEEEGAWTYLVRVVPKVLQKFGKVFYVAFFLVVHLMKLHSMSLIWGVTSEAMEYEEQAETREIRKKELKMEETKAAENFHRDFKTKPNQKGGKRSQ